MTAFSKPCPDPVRGIRCPLCGGRKQCNQPLRPKEPKPASNRSNATPKY